MMFTPERPPMGGYDSAPEIKPTAKADKKTAQREARKKFVEESTHGVETGLAKVFEATEELKEALREAREESLKDPLTGLDNRRGFAEKGQLLLEQLRRKQIRSLTMLMIDVDHFKKINETYGHPGGDAVLRGFSEEIKKIIRPTDVAARYGGEEFIFLFPDATEEDIMRRLRNLYEIDPSADVPAHLGMIVKGVDTDEFISFTVSGGISEFDPNDPNDTIPKVTIRANNALLWAKDQGRDKIIRHSDMMNQSSDGNDADGELEKAA